MHDSEHSRKFNPTMNISPRYCLLVLSLMLNACQAMPKLSSPPIIDSNLTLAQALEGVDKTCLIVICTQQRLVTVQYYSFDQKIHQGQVLIHQDLVADIKTLFDFALSIHFPIQSVIPIAEARFRKQNHWDDELSMAQNNTSAFNYRLSTQGKKLSNHAYGRAIDLNPLLNPYIKANITLPAGAVYNPAQAGTLTATHPLVKKFLQLGWSWGGNWKTLKDYQHFEK